MLCGNFAVLPHSGFGGIHTALFWKQGLRFGSQWEWQPFREDMLQVFFVW